MHLAPLCVVQKSKHLTLWTFKIFVAKNGNKTNKKMYKYLIKLLMNTFILRNTQYFNDI